MADVAKKYQEELPRIKKNVEQAYEYFRDNYVRWHRFKKFLYVSSLSEEDINVLEDLQKPQLEFNILESYVSRQKGEFSKQVPDIEVMSADTSDLVCDYYEKQKQRTKMDDVSSIVDIVEGYIRYVEAEARKDNTAYSLYDDMLSGGFSVAKVYTEYANNRVFHQDIRWRRVFDPCLCGFDPAARTRHKADGDYCFENFVLRKEDFLKQYKINSADSSFQKYDSNGPFQWSYKNAKEEFILVCDYYEKKKQRTKMVLLSNGLVMEFNSYDAFLREWEAFDHIEQPPRVIQERFAYITKIVRFRFVENKVLEHDVTDFSFLPLVFFDGDSVHFRSTLKGQMEQFTRPYCYQAIGVQRLKNFCGQTLANEIENMIQHKFKVPKKGIPPECAESYKDIQHSDILVYNQYRDDDPTVPLNPPQEIPRIPTPPEVMSSFRDSDQTTQAILGTYDAALGIQKHELSGVAIVEGATQSNAAAMPFLVGYLSGLNQIAQIILDLIPKYIITPRKLSIVNRQGETNLVTVNEVGSPLLKFPCGALSVKVKAGVNFSIQKSRALTQIIGLMQASPLFAQFINSTPKGLKALLDNIEMRGIDSLKDSVDDFMKQVQQQQVMKDKQDPEMLKMQIAQSKVQLEVARLQELMRQNERRNQADAAKLAVEDKAADTQRLAVLAKIDGSEAEREITADKIQAERDRAQVDLALKTIDMRHRHAKNAVEFIEK